MKCCDHHWDDNPGEVCDKFRLQFVESFGNGIFAHISFYGDIVNPGIVKHSQKFKVLIGLATLKIVWYIDGTLFNNIGNWRDRYNIVGMLN